jgi:hypothetical protein
MPSPQKRARAVSEQGPSEQVVKHASSVKRRRVTPACASPPGEEVIQASWAELMPLNADVTRVIGGFMEHHDSPSLLSCFYLDVR